MQHQEPPFLEDLRLALAMPSPAAMIEAASVIASFDARSIDEDDGDEDELEFRLSQERTPGETYPYAFAVLELAPMFVTADAPETNALLRVWGEMLGDDMLRRRVHNSVSTREHPAWLSVLGQTKVTRAISIGDHFGEEETVLLEVRSADHSFTIACAIQHLGMMSLEDAYLIPLSIEAAFGDLPAEVTNGSVKRDLNLHDARHLVSQAAEFSERIYPPIETESWPGIKPALEWLLRLMPEAPEASEAFDSFDEDAKAAKREEYAHAFTTSPEGRALPAHELDETGLLFDFQHNYGTGDTLRWGPLFVENLMLNLYPRKLAAPDHILLQLPSLLTAVVKWANPQSGVPAEATDRVLKLIQKLTPQYRELVASGEATPFPFGAGALSDPNFLESMGLGELMSELAPGLGAASGFGAGSASSAAPGFDTDFDADFDEDFAAAKPFAEPRLTAYLMTIPIELRADFRRASSPTAVPGTDTLIDFLLERFPAQQPRYTPALMREYSQIMLEREVGGADALATLDAKPLPAELIDEAFAHYDIAADVLPRLQGIGDILVPRATALFTDPELVTVALRVLARTAAADPALFRRRSKDENAAAAACWVAAYLNEWFNPHSGSGRTMRAVGEAFGMKVSPRDRGETLVRSMGAKIYLYSGEFFLGDPGLLVSTHRAEIIESRDFIAR